MIIMWEELSESGGEEEEDDTDFDPEVEHWDRVRSPDNPSAIGSVMTARVRQERGFDLDLRCLIRYL